MSPLNVRDNAMSDDHNDDIRHWNIEEIPDIHKRFIHRKQIIEYILRWNIYIMNEEVFSSEIWIIQMIISFYILNISHDNISFEHEISIWRQVNADEFNFDLYPSDY